MPLQQELFDYVAKTFRDPWATRRGTKVPETADIALSNDGVLLDAVVLYADLAESTSLVRQRSAQFAAEIYKNYLYCAARIIRSVGGAITAYDGDRVMAVYIGDSKNSNAAKTALRIHRAVTDVINPALSKQYPAIDYRVRSKVGIDASELLVARTGIRGSNDLVWVGNAANRAAKLAAYPTTYASYITADVFGRLNEEAKYANGQGTEVMWRDLGYKSDVGAQIYGSSWMQWY